PDQAGQDQGAGQAGARRPVRPGGPGHAAGRRVQHRRLARAGRAGPRADRRPGRAGAALAPAQPPRRGRRPGGRRRPGAERRRRAPPRGGHRSVRALMIAAATADTTVLAAFAVGFVSFISPCVPKLNREWRPEALISRAGSGGPLVAGAAFALAWTPCIGPTLSSILAAASTSDSVGHGGVLLAFYSAGLAGPFLLTAVLF